MRIRQIQSAMQYSVTDNGEVINILSGRRRNPQNDGRAGYMKLCIKHNDGVVRPRFLHHLVAEAFLGPRPKGYDIDHIDGDKSNNSASNLRYCSRRENQDNPNNAGRNGWQLRAARKVVAEKDGKERIFDNAVTASRVLGICLSGICNVLSSKPVNKGWRNGKPRFCFISTCGGYRFRFLESA